MATETAQRRRLPRRTMEETRALMLAAATEVVCAAATDSGEEAAAAALAHVRVKQVVQAATRLERERSGRQDIPPITIGSAYQIWSTQAEFQADLLVHLAEEFAVLVPGVPESLDRFHQAVAQGVPVTEMVRQVLGENHEYTRSQPLFRVILTFYASAANPRVRQALERLDEAFTAAANTAWQGMLDAYRLRMRPPYRIQHLTASIAALLNGFHIHSIVRPDGLRDPAGEAGWSLVTRTAVALFEQLTEPAPDAGAPGR
jgi:hypothetical protein